MIRAGVQEDATRGQRRDDDLVEVLEGRRAERPRRAVVVAEPRNVLLVSAENGAEGAELTMGGRRRGVVRLHSLTLRSEQR